MTETTLPKTRKPFRGRRPRRPGQGNPQGGAAGEFAVADGERGESAGAPIADTGSIGAAGPSPDTAAVPAPGAGEGTPRGPRPPRPQRQGRKNHGPHGGRSEGGEAVQGGGQPRQNDGQPGNRQGKPRFERGRGGKGGHQSGRGQGQGGGQGGDGQPAWGARGGGPERGNEFRRNTGGGQKSAEPVRLSSLLVSRELCSQREADSFIERGWVIVNGERCASIGARVHPAAEIRLAPEARGEQSRGVTILFNKPVDCVATGAGDVVDGEFESAFALIGAESLDDRYDGPLFNAAHLRDLRLAGSLDVDSMGLLVLTQDDRVVTQLGSEDSAVEMEYLVGVEAAPAEEVLAALNAPIEVGGVQLTPVRVARHGERELKIVLTGGEPRLHRMLEQVGLTITSVKRIRIGLVRLGDVPQGKWRYLRDDESF